MISHEELKRNTGKRIEVELSVRDLRYEGEISGIDEAVYPSYLVLNKKTQDGELSGTWIRTDMIKSYRIYDREEV